jgi:ribosomal protein S18 acetylase RimI-like enzyme
MQAARIEGSRSTKRCIQFLKEHSCCNLYLYEGIDRQSARYFNYGFKVEEELFAVLHTKSGSSVHLFLSEDIPVSVLKRVSRFIIRRFRGLSSIFGDSVCILRLVREDLLRYSSVREYLYFEIEKKHFKPIGSFSGYPPPIEEANALWPLQYQYEIEEMRVSDSMLDREKITAALRRRIQRGEITAIFEKDRPVAIAGVNAKFENICQIGSVYVLPEYRGKGYGYSVVSSHVKRLFDWYDRIALFVDVRNMRARHIYERLGFVAAGALAQVSV